MADNDLNMLKHITSGVEKMEAELSNKNFPECESKEENSEILNSRIRDCDALINELQNEQAVVSKTLDKIRGGLTTLRKDPEEQIKKLRAFEEDLSVLVKDQGSMEEARRQVSSINQQQFAALKNLRRPPKILEELIIGIAYLFGVNSRDGSKSTRKKTPVIQWADARRFIIQMETKEKILKFNPLICKMEDIEKSRHWIQRHASSFDMARIKRASKSFAPLAAWLNLSMQLAVKYKNTTDLNVRKITLNQRINKIRNWLARSRKDTNYIENIEKKVSGIFDKQRELEKSVRNQRKKLEKRLGNLSDKETRRESISLQHVDTLRGEYHTEVFCDWKAMMKDSKKKKKTKKKRKRKKKVKPQDDDEEVKLICHLSEMDSKETEEAKRQKGREEYIMRNRTKSIRNLTGLTGENENEVKVWREGQGWVIPDEEKKDDEKTGKRTVEEEKRSGHGPSGSASIMKGLIKHLRSESQMRQSMGGNELMKFLSVIRARLDTIDAELE